MDICLDDLVVVTGIKDWHLILVAFPMKGFVAARTDVSDNIALGLFASCTIVI